MRVCALRVVELLSRVEEPIWLMEESDAELVSRTTPKTIDLSETVNNLRAPRGETPYGVVICRRTLRLINKEDVRP